MKIAYMTKQVLTSRKMERVDFFGKQIKFTHDNSSYTGKAMGIDAEGNLEIKLRNGKKKFLHSGKVKIQK